MTGGQPRFPWLPYAATLVVIGLFTFSPVIVLAFANAGHAGTPLQLTDLMAAWGALGWLVLAPFPLGMFALGGWLVAILTHLWVRRHQRRKASRP